MSGYKEVLEGLHGGQLAGNNSNGAIVERVAKVECSPKTY